jgi:hypothetical protein
VQAAALDIEVAYQTIPCAPNHKHYIMAYFDGFFYLDHNLPFCIALATTLQGEVTGVILHIWKSLKIQPTTKWVDDIAVFHFPSAHDQFLNIPQGKVYWYDYM